MRIGVAVPKPLLRRGLCAADADDHLPDPGGGLLCAVLAQMADMERRKIRESALRRTVRPPALEATEKDAPGEFAEGGKEERIGKW